MLLRVPHSRRAFTLIEVLVAMAILGVIIVAIYSSWMSIVRGQKVGMDAAADVQRARMAAQTVSDAISGAEMFTENLGLYSFSVDTSDPDFARITFTSYLPANFPGSGKFGNEHLRGVTFYTGADPEGRGNNLYVGQLPLLSEDGVDPLQLTLAHYVTKFQLQFLDNQVTPPEWVDDWDRTNALPASVRVTLGFGTQGKNSKIVTYVHRTVNIPVVAVTRQYQAPDLAGGGAPGAPGNPRNPGNPGGIGNPGGVRNPGGIGNPGGVRGPGGTRNPGTGNNNGSIFPGGGIIPPRNNR